MSDGFFPGLESNEVLIGLAMVVLSTIGAAIGARLGGGTLREEFKDPASRDELITRYRATGHEAYSKAINGVSGFATRFYGERLVSLQSFGRCLQIAFLYPVLALLIGWLPFDTTTLGGFSLLESNPNVWDRAWRVALVPVGWVAGYLILLNEKNFTDWVVARLDRNLDNTPNRAGFLTEAARLGVRVFAVAFAGDLVEFNVWFLFLTTLPILNAAADTASIAATRSFLAHLGLTRAGLGRILSLLLWDICIATMCLTALIGGFIIVLELWAAIAPDSLLFDWRAYRDAMWADPGQGTMLYLMCLTTLIPTIIHLWAGLGAVLTQWSWMLRRVADDFEAEPQPLSQARANYFTRRVGRAHFVGIMVAFLVLALISFGIWRAVLWWSF